MMKLLTLEVELELKRPQQKTWPSLTHTLNDMKIFKIKNTIAQ
jgi:hypothetical protein